MKEKIKYKIVLPKLDKWEDVYDLVSERWTIGSIADFIEVIEKEYPHGIRIGDKYIQL